MTRTLCHFLLSVGLATGLIGLSCSTEIVQAAERALECSASPPDTVETASPTFPPQDRPRRATTLIDAALVKTRLPCEENVNTSGLFGNDQLANLQRGFDFFSWLTFAALNAPADGSAIVDSRPDAPTKWEDPAHFIQLADVMLPHGAVPKWDERHIPAACQSQHRPGMMVIQMIEETFNQPFKTGPLIDQRGNYALFDILMNSAMFDYITMHHLYNKAEQSESTLKIDFPAGDSSKADSGAIMLKVSWRILEGDDDPKKFHTVDALVSMPASPNASEPPCVLKTLGLVGFHAVHKTKNRPQWIWSTFEHVDNVPEQREVDSRHLRHTYNFFDPSCELNKCPINETPPHPWDPDPALKLKFHNSFNSQIVRVIPLTQEVRSLNRQFQNALGNGVWKNYMLVSTQWPSDFGCTQKHSKPFQPPAPDPSTDFEKQPDMTCSPAPTFLANSTLETYSQGTVPLASSSCMACHGNAVSYQRPRDRATDPLKDTGIFNQSDFTFILEKAR
jgi:hypothetical protein